MLERRGHASAAFVTLTYSPCHLQDVTGSYVVAGREKVSTLVPRDLTSFIKRLRARVEFEFRFYAVGEYGDRTKRPHYHVALFGFPSCLNGRTQHLAKTCCSVCKTVEQAWGKGGIDVGELTEQSAQYIAGYCEKKWKKEDLCQPRRTPSGMNRPIYLKDGRHREFCRMSLRPGIGATAIMNLAISGAQSPRGKSVIESLDAPVVLRNNGYLLPLGRYLKRKWREALGRSPDTPQSVLGQYREELWSVLKEDEVVSPSGCLRAPAKAAFHHWRKNLGKIASMEARSKIYKQEKTL